MVYDKNPVPYRESKEEIEKWVVKNIKVEFRNGYREVLGIPLNEKDPMPKDIKGVI